VVDHPNGESARVNKQGDGTRRVWHRGVDCLLDELNQFHQQDEVSVVDSLEHLVAKGDNAPELSFTGQC